MLALFCTYVMANYDIGLRKIYPVHKKYTFMIIVFIVQKMVWSDSRCSIVFWAYRNFRKIVSLRYSGYVVAGSVSAFSMLPNGILVY